LEHCLSYLICRICHTYFTTFAGKKYLHFYNHHPIFRGFRSQMFNRLEGARHIRTAQLGNWPRSEKMGEEKTSSHGEIDVHSTAMRPEPRCLESWSRAASSQSFLVWTQVSTGSPGNPHVCCLLSPMPLPHSLIGHIFCEVVTLLS
jgi:hypothetical protein